MFKEGELVMSMEFEIKVSGEVIDDYLGCEIRTHPGSIDKKGYTKEQCEQIPMVRVYIQSVVGQLCWRYIEGICNRSSDVEKRISDLLMQVAPIAAGYHIDIFRCNPTNHTLVFVRPRSAIGFKIGDEAKTVKTISFWEDIPLGTKVKIEEIYMGYDGWRAGVRLVNPAKYWCACVKLENIELLDICTENHEGQVYNEYLEKWVWL